MNSNVPRRAIALISLLLIGTIAGLTAGRHPGEGTPVPGTLPTVNAIANATSAALLCLGWLAIRRRRRDVHQRCMLGAVAASGVFLVGYLLHHAQAGSVPFAGPEALRPIYFTVLIPHIVLSAVVTPMALTTLWHAYKGQFDAHRRIARWTLPLWLYVSVSGVAVYWMLYRI